MPPATNALKTTLFPGHAVKDGEVKVSDNAGGTVTECVALAVQPNGVSPITVYIVLLKGDTVTVLPVRFPGNQV